MFLNVQVVDMYTEYKGCQEKEIKEVKYREQRFNCWWLWCTLKVYSVEVLEEQRITLTKIAGKHFAAPYVSDAHSQEQSVAADLPFVSAVTKA